MIDPAATIAGPPPSELREKWFLLTASVTLLVFAHGFVIHALPFIYPAIIRDTGWSREQVTLLASIQFGSGAIVSIFFGRLMDRIGDRRAIAAAAVINATAITCFLLVDSLWSFYLVGLAFGMSTPGVFTGVKTLVSRRFTRQQGTAVGIALTGTDIGGAIVPLLIVLFLAMMDWREAIALTTLGTWFIALPLFLWATREQAGDVAPVARTRPAAAIWPVLRQLAATRDFWLIAISVFLMGAIDLGIQQHQVLYLTQDRGLSTTTVAAMAAAFSVISIGAKIAFGAIYDRFSIAGIVAAYLLLVIDPLLAIFVVGPVTGALFVLTRGIAHGGLIVDGPVLAKQVYGNANIGLIIGIFSACLQMGFATGPLIMGRVHSMFGSYVPGFLLFSGLALVSAIMISRVRPTYWLATRAKASAEELDRL